MNRALLGAVRKGIAAAAAGASRDSCPYEDKRKGCGRLTWSRAFRRAWMDGYDGRLTDTDRRAIEQQEAAEALRCLAQGARRRFMEL